MKKSPVLLLTVLAVVLLGMVILWSNHRPGSSTTVEVTTEKPDLPVPEVSASYPQGARLEPLEGQDDRADSIRIRFERANDLHAYVNELAAKANAGDADAAWMISRVYDYCGPYSANPAGYSRDTETLVATSSATATSLTAHRAKVASRCARFSPQDDLSSGTLMRVQQAAAKAGSLPAEASLLAARQPLSTEPGYENALVERVRSSRDPEAYLALSVAMGPVASEKEWDIKGLYGVPNADIAWQLAACQAGLDCGPRSALMTMYCANGGICSTDPNQDFRTFVFDAAVPRQSADRLNEMVRSILPSGR